MPVIPDADVLVGGFGRYLAMADDAACYTRVLSCQDWDGDVYGTTVKCTDDWRGTAALVILGWEHAVDVLYAVVDPDRNAAWRIARSQPNYSGLTNEFYQDDEGWMVVVFRSLGTA